MLSRQQLCTATAMPGGLSIPSPPHHHHNPFPLSAFGPQQKGRRAAIESRPHAQHAAARRFSRRQETGGAGQHQSLPARAEGGGLAKAKSAGTRSESARPLSDLACLPRRPQHSGDTPIQHSSSIHPASIQHSIAVFTSTDRIKALVDTFAIDRSFVSSALCHFTSNRLASQPVSISPP